MCQINAISQEEKKVELPFETRKKVLDWLINEIMIHSEKEGVFIPIEQLQVFRKKVDEFMFERFKTLHCVNLRTYTRNSKLHQFAMEAGFPSQFLPKNVSIIIPSGSIAYYCVGSNYRFNLTA